MEKTAVKSKFFATDINLFEKFSIYGIMKNLTFSLFIFSRDLSLCVNFFNLLRIVEKMNPKDIHFEGAGRLYPWDSSGEIVDETIWQL